jgi:hypothetical protein
MPLHLRLFPQRHVTIAQISRAVASRSVSPSINLVGEERVVTPVTLPRLSFTAEPLVDDDAHKTEQIITIRIIRAGRDAWEEITKAESFDAWERIGAAIAIGKAHALRLSQANAPWGATYCRQFSTWAKEHGFGTMRASDRSYAIALHENIGAITAWRGGLSDRERGRLVTAQSNVKKWRASTKLVRRQCPGDIKRQATMHWRRFIQTMRLLPPTEAEALWQQSLFEMVQP